MGLGDSGLLAVGKDIDSTLIEMLDEMMKENDEAELISVYYGEDVTEEDAEAVVAKIEENILIQMLNYSRVVSQFIIISYQ